MEKHWRAAPPAPPASLGSRNIHEPASSPEEAQWGTRIAAWPALQMSSLTTGYVWKQLLL